jgi:hydrogenase expression/formation protein HypE
MSSISAFQCPLPTLDFDVITLGHGSGGTLTQKLLDSGVFAVLENPLLNERHDGAVIPWNGPLAFSTDSYVVSPIFFPGGSIADLAVNGTVNDLAMCGARARHLSLSFIIEEGLPVTEFWNIITRIRQACDAAGVTVVTGDTKVVERGKGDKIFINTSGIGEMHPQAAISHKNIRPGDCIIVSNHIAAHGMAIMSVRKGLEFESEISSDTRALGQTVFDLLNRFGRDIHFLRDPTRGGVASVLNEVATDARTGIRIEQKSIPVQEAVAGACELLGLDPLYVANEGVFIAVVPAAIADAVVAFLQSHPGCSGAACIGVVTAEHPGQVVLTSALGGRRVVNRLAGEQLPRIC